MLALGARTSPEPLIRATISTRSRNTFVTVHEEFCARESNPIVYCRPSRDTATAHPHSKLRGCHQGHCGSSRLLPPVPRRTKPSGSPHRRSTGSPLLHGALRADAEVAWFDHVRSLIAYAAAGSGGCATIHTGRSPFWSAMIRSGSISNGTPGSLVVSVSCFIMKPRTATWRAPKSDQYALTFG